MRVKARILVQGVRQMNCNEIPDIWQMAEEVFQSTKHAKLPMKTLPSTLDTGSQCSITCIMN